MLRASALVVAAFAIIVVRGPSAHAQTDAGARTDDGAPAAAAQQDEGGFGTDWAVLPIVVYTPETDLLLGAGGMYFFDLGHGPEQRSSLVAASGVVSTLGQWIVGGRTELWLDHNDWSLQASAYYRDWPDYFFGIGNHAGGVDEEPFRLRRFELVHQVERRIAGHLYAGVVSRIERSEIVDVEADGMLATNTAIRGRDGGTLSGVGLLASFDTRDSTAYATRGGYYHAELVTFQTPFGTDESLTHTAFLLDLRQFIPLSFAEGHALALQLFAQLTDGGAPFNRMPRLGGSEQLRGYYEGRFRDNHVVVAQVEYRMPLVWRFKLALFASIGQVLRRLQDYRWDELHAAIGLGLRFCASDTRRAHIRLDVAYGGPDAQHPVGVYFTMLEAF